MLHERFSVRDTDRLGREVVIEEFVEQIIGNVEEEEKKASRSVIRGLLVLALGIAALLLIYFLGR